MSGIRLIVGLANPGKQYSNTRHNVGAWFLSALAKQAGASLSPEAKFHGHTGKAMIDNRPCYLLEPTTYMNESGRAVRAMMDYYKLSPDEILVAHDELDFEPGIIRFKQSGGHGGHNGLRDIIACLGTKDFNRMRIGIGHPGNRNKVTGYVLGEPSKSDKQAILSAIDDGLRVIDQCVAGQYDRVMDQLHS